MAHYFKIAIIAFLLTFSVSAASVDQYPFTQLSQQADFIYLTQHLRCLVCSNQTIAESNAPLASDLRKEVYQQVLQGKSRDEILQYVVARYGDYVLYSPPIKPVTYFLWFGPMILLVLVICAVCFFIRRQSRKTELALTPEEQKRINELLGKSL